MECQTCSKTFLTTDDLHEHCGQYQARALFFIRELQKCLTHASEEGEDGASPAHRSDKSDTESLESSMSNFGNEHESPANDMSRCPVPACEQLKHFAPKELQRHYATHVPCQEFCPHCQRSFERASQYLHHRCNKVQGQPNERILRRRKMIRQKVEKALQKALQEARKPVQQKKKRPDVAGASERRNGRRSRTRRYCQSAENTTNAHYTDSTQMFDYSNHDMTPTSLPVLIGSVAHGGANAPVQAGNSLKDIQPVSISSTTGAIPSASTQMLSTCQLEASFPEMSHAMTDSPSFMGVSSMPAHEPAESPYLSMAYGSKAPALYLGARSESGELTMQTMSGSKIPSMYSGVTMASKAPIMYSETDMYSMPF